MLYISEEKGISYKQAVVNRKLNPNKNYCTNGASSSLFFSYDPLDTKIIVTPLVHACSVNDTKIEFFATDTIEDAERSYFANSASDLEGKLSIVGLIVEKHSKI